MPTPRRPRRPTATSASPRRPTPRRTSASRPRRRSALCNPQSAISWGAAFREGVPVSPSRRAAGILLGARGTCVTGRPAPRMEAANRRRSDRRPAGARRTPTWHNPVRAGGLPAAGPIGRDLGRRLPRSPAATAPPARAAQAATAAAASLPTGGLRPPVRPHPPGHHRRLQQLLAFLTESVYTITVHGRSPPSGGRDECGSRGADGSRPELRFSESTIADGVGREPSKWRSESL